MIVELLVSSCFGFQAPPAEVPATQPPQPVTAPAPAEQVPSPAPPSTPLPPGPGTPAFLPPAAIPAQGAPPAPGARPAVGPKGLSTPRTPAPPGQWTAQNVYGMGMNGQYGYTVAPGGGFTFYRPMDPKEADLDRKARDTAGNYHREQDPQKKAALKASLQTLLAEQFQMRQQRRQEDIKRLEDELKRLRDANDKREKSKDAIIARRIAELTGEDDLGF